MSKDGIVKLSATDRRRGGLQVDAATHGAAGERGLDDANCGIGVAG